MAIAVATFAGFALIAQPVTAAAAPRPKLAPPPNTIHHTKTIGQIDTPLTCGPQPPPSPAITTIAWVAESSNNEVQAIDEPTGALIGSAITVGTSPQGIGYWRPVTSSHMDPEIVVANNGSSSVTLIDAETSSVLATVTLPTGSAPTAVATSPLNRFALVVDAHTGDVSIINLQTQADQGEISLTSTANALSSIAFSASGAYAYVTDPSEHKIFVIDHTPGVSPYYALYSTYTNSAYNPTGVATDLSTSSSSTLVVGNAKSTYSLLSFSDASGSLSTPTLVTTFTSAPGPISLSPGATYAYVGMTSTKTINDVTLSSGNKAAYTAQSSFTAVGPLGLSADGSTLLTADTGSATVEEMSATAGTNQGSTTTDATVSAIAPALAQSGSWDVYVTVGTNIDVVNTQTQSVTQTIADANTPVALAASPDGQYVYAANNGGTVAVIKTAYVGTPTNPVLFTITVPKGPESNTPNLNGIAVSPSGNSVLVSDTANGAVEVIDMNQGDGSSYKTVVSYIGLSGSGSSSSYTPQGVTLGADGKYAYVPVVTGGSQDGVTVLQEGATSANGYSYSAKDLGLTQDGDTLLGPVEVAVNPNGETAYVGGTYSGAPHSVVFSFPIATTGQLSNGSSTVAPTSLGTNLDGVAFSPEDDSVFATSTSSYVVSSIALPGGSVAYNSSTGTSAPGQLAVSPDGMDIAVAESNQCGTGSNQVGLYDAGSGTLLGNVALSAAPGQLVVVPQASPQAVNPSDLAGGATNPSESAVTSGMNDVVTAGTPSDAPGASGVVDTATGAYSLSIDSMRIPDLGIPLDESATYDSSRAAINGLLGYGWQYSYGITAAQNAHNASSNPCAITFTQEDAATVSLFPSAQGPYSTCPTSGYEARGWAQATLSFQTSCNGSDTCWVLTRGATTKYFVDATNGELVKEQDLNGNAVTLTWGAHTACSGATSSEPCQVMAADGIRTLTFSYPAAGSGTCPSGSYTCVVVTDPLGRTLTYVKNSTGDLVQVSLASGTETATYAMTYGSGHVLASWWDPSNQANHSGNTTYAMDVTYNASGLVTQVTGPPIASVAPLSTTQVTPTTTFAYPSYSAASGDGTVLVDNPDFNQSASEPGASQTLDTYADFELVSSVQGYGPVAAYGSSPTVQPNPSESAYPMRDGFNLMASESMNALAGSTESPIGSQNAQYDNGVVLTTYDAQGNALSTTDELGHSTSSTYNALEEVLSSTDAMGNQTVNTYSSTGELLTTTSPAPNGQSARSETSSFYNSNGTLCASRDADQVAAFGALTSCVSSGSNATTYSYDSSGDVTLSTVTDSATATSTTQSEYDSNGNVCATLSPDGYAISADRLTGCPTGGAPYATVTLSRDVYGNPLETKSSLSVSGTNTYATTYSCTDANGNTTASVGPLGSAPTCPDTAYTTSVDTTFTTYDPYGDKVQSITPFATSGSQGPTSTSQFDADASDVLDLSASGYVVWVNNNSADLTPYETGTLLDDQGNQVASAPETDLTSACRTDLAGAAPGQVPSSLCPDTSFSAFDNQGQGVNQASSGNQDGGGSGLSTSPSVNNPDGSLGGNQSQVGGGTGVQETAQQTYNQDAASTNTVNEHWNGSVWVTDSATSTAYGPDGSQCWTSPSSVSTPSCSAPPTGTATVDYYDANGNTIAQVGPGGSGTVGTGTYCNPTDAFTSASAYSINTAELCAFTTYSVFNEAGKLIETIEPSASSSPSGYVTAGATTTYSYDASGNQTSEVNPAGNTVSSTFDGANRLIGVTYSDAGTTNCSAGGSTQDTCYAYNADGTRSQMIDSTGTTSYSYNSAGQLSSVTDSNGNTVTYGYNSFGQQSCISYPGFSHNCSSTGAGTNSPPSGDVTDDYDAQGRLSSVVDWNGDAFTYAYDCTGDVAWLAETPSSQIPSVSQCQGSSGSVASAPAPSSSGVTYVVTSYAYSSGGSGNLLSSQTTSAVTSSGSTSLLGFGSSSVPLTYDDNNNLTSSTPYVSGMAQNADNYGYDTQQRVTSGPETSGSKTAYSYTNTSSPGSCNQPYCSHFTVDQMGIDAMPQPGATAQLGSEYQGNGSLCWVAQVTSTTGTCSNPGGSSTNYETLSYNSSGDLTSSSAHGYGASSAFTWNVDTNEPTCINPSGTSCLGPSSSQPQAATYTYNANGLRMTSKTWNASSSSVVATDFTWNTRTSALHSNGTFVYLYGLNSNVPIAQLDTGDSDTGMLLSDPSSNVRGIVEASPGAANAWVLANYTDYDAYGNPMTKSGGAVVPGGLATAGFVGDPDSLSEFGFAGGYQDPSALIYLVARYYSAVLGQFVSIDPAVRATRNPFSYAKDDPSNLTDDTGNNPYQVPCIDDGKPTDALVGYFPYTKNVASSSPPYRVATDLYCWSVIHQWRRHHMQDLIRELARHPDLKVPFRHFWTQVWLPAVGIVLGNPARSYQGNHPNYEVYEAGVT